MLFISLYFSLWSKVLANLSINNLIKVSGDISLLIFLSLSNINFRSLVDISLTISSFLSIPDKIFSEFDLLNFLEFGSFWKGLSSFVLFTYFSFSLVLLILMILLFLWTSCSEL